VSATARSANRLCSEEKLLRGAFSAEFDAYVAESPLYLLAFYNPVHRRATLKLHLYRCTIE